MPHEKPRFDRDARVASFNDGSAAPILDASFETAPR